MLTFTCERSFQLGFLRLLDGIASHVEYLRFLVFIEPTVANGFKNKPVLSNETRFAT